MNMMIGGINNFASNGDVVICLPCWWNQI